MVTTRDTASADDVASAKQRMRICRWNTVDKKLIQNIVPVPPPRRDGVLGLLELTSRAAESAH
jgi:hypothetical protein